MSVFQTVLREKALTELWFCSYNIFITERNQDKRRKKKEEENEKTNKKQKKGRIYVTHFQPNTVLGLTFGSVNWPRPTINQPAIQTTVQ